jgi:hypothetical protein
MSLVYLYGFVPPDVQLPARGLLGVGDAEVELVPGDGFAAVVCRPPEEEFSDAALERRGSDMEWVAEQGLRHEQVVAWFVDHASILPSRLLTLFSSTAALDERVASDAERIRRALDRFADLREWNLKAGYDPARLEAHLGEISEQIGNLDREIETAAPGKGYLLKRKRAELARTEGRAAARRLASELLTDLERRAEDAARLTPAADDAPIVLNAALLIARADEADAQALVRREADRLARLGITIQYSGPWAPYRFMEGDDG